MERDLGHVDALYLQDKLHSQGSWEHALIEKVRDDTARQKKLRNCRAAAVMRTVGLQAATVLFCSLRTVSGWS